MYGNEIEMEVFQVKNNPDCIPLLQYKETNVENSKECDFSHQETMDINSPSANSNHSVDKQIIGKSLSDEPKNFTTSVYFLRQIIEQLEVLFLITKTSVTTLVLGN